MNTPKLFAGLLFSISISIAAYADDSRDNEQSTRATALAQDMATVTSHHPRDERLPKAPPLKPYPRLLPLQLRAPATAQLGKPVVGVSVTLHNPGKPAPDARLRLIIHDKNYNRSGDHLELSPDNVKLEVLEGTLWKPVHLGSVENGVMGAIGTEMGTAHRERHKRGGFAIPAGLNKTWQLRLTISLPGTYSLVAAVSPDNGSRHLARPAHSIIEVQ